MNPQSARVTTGERIQLDGFRGTVRFVGRLHGRGANLWAGVEWDDTSRGKHCGTYDGHKYFNCAPGTGSFVKMSKMGNGGRKTLLEAVKKRYTEDALDTTFRESTVIVGGGLISIEDRDGKRPWVNVLSQLEFVDVSAMAVAAVKEVELGQKLPEMRELRIARNLFEGPKCLLEILEAFPQLRVLDASDNILEVQSEDNEGFATDMRRIRRSELEELILNRCTLSWTTVRMICEHGKRLRTLRLHGCGLGRINNALQLNNNLETIRTLDMDGNELEWEDVTQCLGKLGNLKEIYLSNNKLHDVHLPDEDCLTKVETLSLANNALDGWKVISWLQRLPALKHLRIRGNPVTITRERNVEKAQLTWRMQVIGRIGGLEVLDGSTITKDERILCEKRYMNVEVACAWLKKGKNAVREHPRADELCELYGMGTGTGNVMGMHDEMVDVRLTAAHSISAKRHFVSRKMPRGARISRVRAVGKRLLGIKEQCRAGIWTAVGCEDEVEWETDLWRTIGDLTPFVSGDLKRDGEKPSELYIVIGSAMAV